MNSALEDQTVETMNAYESPDPPKWEIGKPQIAVDALVRRGIESPVLDIGCGTGENALLMTKRGHQVTAIDPSLIAIEKAEQKARVAKLELDFQVGSGLDLGHLGQVYETVIDSGVFHIFTDVQRVQYLSNIKSVLKTGGLYYGLCFSEREPGDWGPRRVTPEEIKALFVGEWELVSLEPSMYQIRRPEPVKAWLITAKRL